MLAAAPAAFGPYLLDSRSRSLTRGGESVGLSPYEYEVLHLLVRRPNVVLSKDVLIRAGWQDTAVGDNSLEKLVSKLRRQLDAGDLSRYIKTVPRQGYQFVAPVTAVQGHDAAPDLELLLAPHRAFTEGRVALESLQCTRIVTARATFQQLLQQHPGEATYQIGMANACAMQFEATRTDPAPDAEALRLAEAHARHACALDPDLAEAWATLGFVLERTGRREHALAALERAVALEPDNWRHQVRLALGSWGETRLRAARRALAQCPQLPLAHWLAATVFVARNALDHAERDVDRGLAVAAIESPDATPYSMVALHWLKGLLRNAAGATDDAMASFDQELALEARVHLYTREAAANTGVRSPWRPGGACRSIRCEYADAGGEDTSSAAFLLKRICVIFCFKSSWPSTRNRLRNRYLTASEGTAGGGSSHRATSWTWPAARPLPRRYGARRRQGRSVSSAEACTTFRSCTLPWASSLPPQRPSRRRWPGAIASDFSRPEPMPRIC